jgi:hypothetical protein
MADDNHGAEITAVASSAPAGDGGAESHVAAEEAPVATSEAVASEHDELAPVIGAAAGASRRGGKAKKGSSSRKMSRAQKDARNAKLKLARDAARAAREKRELAKKASAIASEPAPASSPPGLKPDMPAPALERPVRDARAIAEGAPAAEVAAIIDDEDLESLLGLGAHAIIELIPEKWGGGTLTEKERQMLGRLLRGPVKPYVSDPESGPWLLVAAGFVQVMGLRAIAYAQRVKNAEPTGHHREVRPEPTTPAPTPATTPAPTPAPAKPAAATPAPTSSSKRRAATSAAPGVYDNDDV